jgi:glycosyltransferase involved in cell wall biosynthesis
VTLSGEEILCFANDWSADPTSKHHIMRTLSETNRVLWVESAGMRRPRLGSGKDLSRLVRKARSFLVPAQQRLPGLWSYSPPALPFPGSPLATQLNARLYRLAIQHQRRRLGLRGAPVQWVYAPHVAPWIRALPRKALVYHCVDRWSAFQDYDAERMAASEAELCRTADLVLASAEDLAERCRRYRSDVVYVPHGVEHGHFAKALEPGELPVDLRDIPGPRIGFFGLIHEWVDLDLLGHLADTLPYSFVLIGDSNQNLEPLLRRSNVHHLGRKPYSALPDYCRGFDTAIVPFRISELTLSVNPIKLREYAAAGLPIVASDLPEIRRCADIARCASGLSEWQAALREAVVRGQHPAERKAQSARVLDQDWSRVAERIGELTQRALAGKAA